MVTYGTMRSETPALSGVACTEQRTPPWPRQASARKHTHTHSIWTACVLHIYRTICQMQANYIIVYSHRRCSFTPTPHTPTPLLHFLPPFLPPSAAHSACALSYLLQPIIVPTYGVSSCKPQFRGSEILLSDCHNASASGEGRTPACSPSLPSSLSSSPRLPPPPPRSLSLTLSVFLAEMLHLCFHCVSSRRPVSFFMA